MPKSGESCDSGGGGHGHLRREREEGGTVKFREIKDERDFYKAVHQYSMKIWSWGAHIDGDWDEEPTPDELIKMLEERIAWVKAHQRAVDKYLKKRHGRGWVRVFDGAADSADGESR